MIDYIREVKLYYILKAWKEEKFKESSKGLSESQIQTLITKELENAD